MSWTRTVRYDDDGVGGWFRLVMVDWLGLLGLIPGGKQGVEAWYPDDTGMSKLFLYFILF